MYHIYPTIPREIIRFISIILATVNCNLHSISSLDHCIFKDVFASSLIEPRESAKVFTFSCVLMGLSSIMLDFTSSYGCFLIPPAISFIVSAFLMLKEFYKKYISALRL